MGKKKRAVVVYSGFAIIVAVLAAIVTVNTNQRASANSTSVGVSIGGHWVAAFAFGASSSVTLSYDTGHDGSVDHTDTLTSDSSGNAMFNLGTLAVQVGDSVEVSDGTTTKTLLVPEIRVEYVNADTNVVSGVAPPLTQLTVSVQQAGPPLAQINTTSNASGVWTVDFTGTYDIEPNREVRADVFDADGDVASSSQFARVPYITAGYSQSGANSLIVSGFTPGTSVNMKVDFGGDGSFEIDSTKIITNPYGESWALGGFDVLHAGDHIIATGGGWTKDLVTVPLRIEKADPTTDEVGGVATSGDLVKVGINPEGPGPWVASLTTTTGVTGRWSVNFTGTYDFNEGRSVNAVIADSDGDLTMTGWNATLATFRADITDGPPSGIGLFGFATGTEVRVRVDYGNDGGTIDGYDFDTTHSVTSPFGDGVSLGGTGLLHAGDRVVVTGGGWEKTSVLVPLTITLADPGTDVVSGTASPSRVVDVWLNPPPGDPGGPPVAHLTTTSDSLGDWSVDFTALFDMVENQSGLASIADTDGDTTSHMFWAQPPSWPTLGFFSPVANPPTLNLQKAGSSVPIRFSLGEFRGYDVFASGYPKSEAIDCSTTPTTNGTDAAVQSGKRFLSYNITTNRYEFNWRTEKSWKGTCRQFVIRFVDGSWMRANFKFG